MLSSEIKQQKMPAIQANSVYEIFIYIYLYFRHLRAYWKPLLHGVAVMCRRDYVELK